MFGLVCTGLMLLASTMPGHAVELKKRDGDPPPGHGQKYKGVFPADAASRNALVPFMGHDRAREAMQNGQIRSLSDIRKRAKKQFGARVVGVELQEGGGAGGVPWVYDLRMLTPEGRVLDVRMDAENGKVISVKGQR